MAAVALLTVCAEPGVGVSTTASGDRWPAAEWRPNATRYMQRLNKHKLHRLIDASQQAQLLEDFRARFSDKEEFGAGLRPPPAAIRSRRRAQTTRPRVLH